MKWKARTCSFYGMLVPPVHNGRTWIEVEEMCRDYGQFRRRGLVIHSKTLELVQVRMDISNTFFSIPATTEKEHGYVTSAYNGEFEFRPHTDQTKTPVEFRKQYRKDCK